MATATIEVTVDVDANQGAGRRLLAPIGQSTPHEVCSGCEIVGGAVSSV